MPMPVTVRCERCGAVYETEATPAAIQEVNRCRECGGPLTVAEEPAREAPEGPPPQAA